MCLFRPGRVSHVKTKRIPVSEPTNLQFNDQQRNLAIFAFLFDRHSVGSILSRWWHTHTRARASVAIGETQKWPSISHISRPNFGSSGKKRPFLAARFWWLVLGGRCTSVRSVTMISIVSRVPRHLFRQPGAHVHDTAQLITFIVTWAAVVSLACTRRWLNWWENWYFAWIVVGFVWLCLRFIRLILSTRKSCSRSKNWSVNLWNYRIPWLCVWGREREGVLWNNLFCY